MLDQLPEWLKCDGLESLGRELKAARQARRWTLDDISEAVGLNSIAGCLAR